MLSGFYPERLSKSEQIIIGSQNMSDITSLLTSCHLCPRNCGVNRINGQTGYCGMPAEIYAARAALHFWEEPCISGTCGSGTVFFSGCSMRCVYCQNHDIAIGNDGQPISIKRLSEIFLELQEKGAANINLVTPTHYIPQIISALKTAKEQGLALPIVYNTSGYEEVSSLRLLDGLIDIYLPDLKYSSESTGQRFSNAPDYFSKASLALQEMFRQTGRPVFDDNGMMKKGMIVRHLLLPGQAGNTKRVLRWLHNTFGNDIYISIMNQYTPMPHLNGILKFQDISRKITDEEYEKILEFAELIGIENGFMQDGETATESFIPPFTGEGL